MIDFIGHLHLLLLHLPIGILLLAAALVLWSQLKKTTVYRQAIEHTVRLGALTAVLAAGCGWVLAGQGDYTSDALEWHRWTGTATALLAVIAWWVQYTKWFFAVIYATTAGVVIAGHFGGTITHGEGYLFEKPRKDNAAIDPAQPAFEAVIQPVLKEKCVNCHNPNKKKGDLILDSFEHLMAGGKHGKVIVPGTADSSELYKRILLPAHDEHRMPPKGKLQLTTEEIDMIGKWIKAGATREMPASAILPDVKPSEFPEATVSIASPAELQRLREQLIPVMQLSNDLPWLSVSLAGKYDLSPALLKSLNTVAEQIVHLDAGFSNLSDEMMEAIQSLKHLTRLHLAGTKVTSAGLNRIAGMKHLRYLNITGTLVDDSSIDMISKLPALQSLYLLDTKITPAGLERLHKQLPGVLISTAMQEDSAAKVLQLLPPKMLYAHSVFDDTVQVKLDFPFKNVGLYYTLDQASPTSQSFEYKGEAIVLSESGMVRAVAIKTGWETSPIIEASFARRKYKPVDIRLEKPPAQKYPAKGAATLSDNILGTDANDGKFLGYQGENLTAILDLGKTVPVTSVGVHYLENNSPWIFAPRGVQVWSSSDGKKWTSCAHATYPVNISMQPTKTAIASAKMQQPVDARYLKVTVESLLKLPKWHPAAGDKCWIFVDEILVE